MEGLLAVGQRRRKPMTTVKFFTPLPASSSVGRKRMNNAHGPVADGRLRDREIAWSTADRQRRQSDRNRPGTGHPSLVLNNLGARGQSSERFVGDLAAGPVLMRQAP